MDAKNALTKQVKQPAGIAVAGMVARRNNGRVVPAGRGGMFINPGINIF
jgi:hypothetical protein